MCSACPIKSLRLGIHFIAFVVIVVAGAEESILARVVVKVQQVHICLCVVLVLGFLALFMVSSGDYFANGNVFFAVFVVVAAAIRSTVQVPNYSDLL